MSFTQAALIVVGLAAVALGLVAYHLLTRLTLLEEAVSGGLTPPSRRLSREEYEQRFSRALARSRLAIQVDSGVVVFLGPEAETHEVAHAMRALDRGEGVFVVHQERAAHDRFHLDYPQGTTVLDAYDRELGVTITPYAFVVDERRITAAAPVTAGGDLVRLVRDHT